MISTCTGCILPQVFLRIFFFFFFGDMLFYLLQNQEVLYLKTLMMNNRGIKFIVLLLRDPHLLKGGERSQDGATDPDGVLPFRGGDDLDLDGGGSEGSQLLLHAVSNTREHGGTARQDNVTVEILTDINVALHDQVVSGLVPEDLDEVM